MKKTSPIENIGLDIRYGNQNSRNFPQDSYRYWHLAPQFFVLQNAIVNTKDILDRISGSKHEKLIQELF